MSKESNVPYIFIIFLVLVLIHFLQYGIQHFLEMTKIYFIKRTLFALQVSFFPECYACILYEKAKYKLIKLIFFFIE